MKRALDEGPMPSLVIVDGGKGQLNVALSVFEELNIIDLDAIGIAKEKIHYRDKSKIAIREATLSLPINRTFRPPPSS